MKNMKEISTCADLIAYIDEIGFLLKSGGNFAGKFMAVTNFTVLMVMVMRVMMFGAIMMMSMVVGFINREAVGSIHK